ncbi:MAG TPA: UbiA family prenyltransferase [Anaerolineales bacterium]|nr:UbiA family prenyltransferase [Anaerolineales bacterium]
MFRNLLRLSRPLHLLLAALTYFLGASIANYLGKPFRTDSFWLGLIAVLLAQASMNLLAEVFRPYNEPILDNETRKDRITLRNNALYVSIAALAADAVIAFLLYQNGHLSVAVFFFLLLSLILILSYSIPPFRFINRGFGEFVLAAHLAYVIPSIAYILQSDETHRFLLITIPLTFLAFAYFIVMDFPSFASDTKYNRSTLLTRLSWERAVPLHHLFVLLTYLFFLASPIFGLSLSLLWPAFLTLPFALFQIFQLRNLALGAPTHWTLLTATALSVFGLTVYFLSLTFWLR